MSAKWTSADVPSQSGRVAIVTGSNTGVGFEAAAVLAEKGAHVVLAVRNLDKGDDAKARITARCPDSVVSVQELDLASLASVRKAADELRAAHPRIDLLINNAGVMTLEKAATEDGFELQFGTNHLGHFALTGLLLDTMLAVDGSRVVGSVTAAGPSSLVVRQVVNWSRSWLETSWIRPRPNCAGRPVMTRSVSTVTSVAAGPDAVRWAVTRAVAVPLPRRSLPLALITAR